MKATKTNRKAASRGTKVASMSLSLLLAFSLTGVGTTFAFADEVEGSTAEPVAIEAVEQATQAEEALAPAEQAAPEAAAPAAAQAEPAAAEAAAPAEAAPTVVEAAAEVEQPKPATAVSAVITIEYMNTSGATATRTVNRTIQPNGSTSLAASLVSSYQRNVNAGGSSYVWTGWADASGNAVSFPLTVTYDQAAAAVSSDGKAHLTFRATYEVHNPITVTLHFDGIRHANGTVTSTSTANSFSWGSGWSFGTKKFESTTGLRAGQTFSYGGCTYTYTGQWADQNGNIIDASTGVKVYHRNGGVDGNTYNVTESTDLYFTPVYEVTTNNGLEVNYIDNVSTGSGSWSNVDSEGNYSAFGSFTHTFSNPEDASPTYAPDYRFVNWQNPETGEVFEAGEAYTYTMDTIPEGTLTVVDIYAMWQPSVTVNYYDADGELLETVQSFENDIDVYASYAVEADADGNAFVGWLDADGNRIDEGSAYELPEVTSENGTATSYDVYADYLEPVIVPASETPAAGGTVPTADPGTAPAAPVSGPSAPTATQSVATPAPAPTAAQAAPAAGQSAAAAQTIADDANPLAAGTTGEVSFDVAGSWSLADLVLTALSAIAALFLLVFGLGRNRRDGEEVKRHRAVRVASVATAAAAIALLILTQDFTQPMAMFDNWTVAFAIVAVAQAVLAIASRKDEREEGEEDEVAQEAAPAIA